MLDWPERVRDMTSAPEAVFADCVRIGKARDGDLNLETVFCASRDNGINLLLMGWHAEAIWGRRAEAFETTELLTDQSRRAAEILSRILSLHCQPYPSVRAREKQFILYDAKVPRLQINSPSNTRLQLIWRNRVHLSVSGLSVLLPSIEMTLADAILRSIDSKQTGVARMQDAIGVYSITLQYPNLSVKTLRSLGDKLNPESGDLVVTAYRRAVRDEPIW